ncbi:MAG: DUF4372 domain-containing protein [Dissulfuribacterales bacterium]
MNKGQTVFSQVIDFLPKKKFCQCVNRYKRVGILLNFYFNTISTHRIIDSKWVPFQ